MTKIETLKLPLGFYRLHWKAGGTSIAAIGQLHNGLRWFAPTNWTGQFPDSIASIKWSLVKRVEPLTAVMGVVE
jgi:hypothetical protein